MSKDYYSIPPHERSLKRIVDSMREDPPVQTSGLEKDLNDPFQRPNLSSY